MINVVSELLDHGADINKVTDVSYPCWGGGGGGAVRC